MNNSRITFESRTAIKSQSTMSGQNFITSEIVVIWFDDEEHGGQARKQTHKSMFCIEENLTHQVGYGDFEPMTNADASVLMAVLILESFEITEVLQY